MDGGLLVTTPATKKPLAPVTEIGYQQPYGYNWWLYSSETTPELVWPTSIAIYNQMRSTDAQCKSILQAVTLPVICTTWRLDPNGARDEVVQFVSEDLGLPIKGSPPKAPLRLKDRFSWLEHLREALLMLPFGHSFFEQVYRVDEDGSRAHLRKLALRPAPTILAVNVAEDGGLVSIQQDRGRKGLISRPIPVDRLVAYVYAKEGANWLGTSVLRAGYKNWLLKDRLLRVQAQTIERNGMGIPLYTAADGAVDLAAGLAMAKAWRAGEAAGTAIPFGATLKLVGVEGTLPDAEPVVRYHDEQLARAVLAHFLNLGTQTGSWALGTTFADFFTMSLQALAQQIADIATSHVVEDLVDVNWGPEERAPRITFDEIGSRQAATAEAMASLVNAGILRPDEVLEESSRQQYGLPPADTATTRPPPGTPPPTDGSVPPPDGGPDGGGPADGGAGGDLPPEPLPVPVAAKFNPFELRDFHGRWSLRGGQPKGDRPHRMADLAYELEGLTPRQKRAKMRKLGFSKAEADGILSPDKPHRMADVAHELHGLSVPQSRAKLTEMGFTRSEVDELVPDHRPSLSDLAYELDRTPPSERRAYLRDQGFSPKEIDDLIGSDKPTSMSDLAYELDGLTPKEQRARLRKLGFSWKEIRDLLGAEHFAAAFDPAELSELDDDEVGPVDNEAPPVQAPVEPAPDLAAAVAEALALFARAPIAAAHDVSSELRIPGGKGGGRWTTGGIGRAIADALEQWSKGKGPDDPFHHDGKPIDREHLRKAGVARGLTFKRGASRDDIVRALLEDARSGAKDAREARAARRASAKFSITDGGKRIDVAVFTDRPGGTAPSLREVDDLGHPGRIITSQPDLAGLERWATTNGHTDVADWAAKERGGKPDVKAPTKRAPAAKRAPSKAKPEVGAPAAPAKAPKGDAPEVDPAVKRLVAGLTDGNREFAEKVLAGKHERGFDGLSATRDPIYATTPAQKARALRNFAETKRRMTDSSLRVNPDIQSVRDRHKRDHAAADRMDRIADALTAKRAPAKKATKAAEKAAPSKAAAKVGGKVDPKVAREIEVENKIRAIYGKLPKAPGGWVGLADLRDRLAEEGMHTAEVDAALRKLSRETGVNVTPVANVKALTPRDHAAAVRIGEDQNHMISIADPLPRPPTVTPSKAVVKAATAKKAAPKKAFDAADVHSRLASATSRDDAHATLQGLTAAQLKDVAKASGTHIGGASTKDAIKSRIVEHTVGFRLNSATIRDGSWTSGLDTPEVPNHPDGLDALKGPQLRKWADEMLPNGGRGMSDAQMRAALRAEGVGSPEEHAKRLAEEAPSVHLSDAQIESKVRDAYAQLISRPGDLVSLADLRDRLPDIPRTELDRILTEMTRKPEVTVVPESNQKMLQPRHRVAAVSIGNQDRHLLVIQDQSGGGARPKGEGVDLSPSSYAARQDALRSLHAGTPVDIRQLGGGYSGQTNVETHADGRKVVTKVYDHGADRTESIRHSDAEELGGRIMAVVGLGPTVVRTGDNKLAMEWIDGKVGTEVIPVGGYDIPADLIASDSGRLMGLAGVIMGDVDGANTGNWIVTADGRVAGIDHGLAFNLVDRPDRHTSAAEREMAGTSSSFARYLTRMVDGRMAWNESIDISPSDIAVIRGRLEALRPEFEKRHRLSWYQDALHSLDVVAGRATGTRSILGP